MGVRRDDPQFKDQVEQVLDKRRSEIDQILREYAVPRVDEQKGGRGV
jgi:hypothetical protein